MSLTGMGLQVMTLSCPLTKKDQNPDGAVIKIDFSCCCGFITNERSCNEVFFDFCYSPNFFIFLSQAKCMMQKNLGI